MVTGSGDPFGIIGTQTQLYVPRNYISGSFLDGSMSFVGQTFASLGVTPGTYVWTWGDATSFNGGDSFTLRIGDAKIPEPATAIIWTMFAGVGVVSMRRRR